MVETLKELNSICQKPNYKKVGNWMVRNITRDMALPLTWLLLHTPISANGVTFAGMIVVLGASACLASPSPLIFLTGAILFQFWYLLDHVDGQIARYRKQSSLTGLYFDFLSHYVTNSTIFLGLGLHVYFVTHRFEAILLSFLGSLSYALLQSYFDCKYRAYYSALRALKGGKVHIQGGSSGNKGDTAQGGLRRIFAFLYKLCEFHVFMNVLTLAALLNLWVPEIHLFGSGTSFPIITFGVYSFLLPLVVSLRIAYTVTHRLIDRDFEKEFVQIP